MRSTFRFILAALLLAGCGGSPEPLGEIQSLEMRATSGFTTADQSFVATLNISFVDHRFTLTVEKGSPRIRECDLIKTLNNDEEAALNAELVEVRTNSYHGDTTVTDVGIHELEINSDRLIMLGSYHPADDYEVIVDNKAELLVLLKEMANNLDTNHECPTDAFDALFNYVELN